MPQYGVATSTLNSKFQTLKSEDTDYASYQEAGASGEASSTPRHTGPTGSESNDSTIS